MATPAKDPVCGMDVQKDKAAGTTEHRGETYMFCSRQCKQEFDKNPDRYAKPSKTSQTP